MDAGKRATGAVVGPPPAVADPPGVKRRSARGAEKPPVGRPPRAGVLGGLPPSPAQARPAGGIGLLGAVYDSDLDLAKKLIEQIGHDLAKVLEFAPRIIEPLKMQRGDALGDFAVRIRAKMMTVPGEQFVIRRQAYAMIKKAFDENGIKFAFPTVQVVGGAEGDATTELTRSQAAE
jgi:hypothetical protein